MLRIIVWSSVGSSSPRLATSASDIRSTEPTSRIISAAPAPLRGVSSCDPSEVRLVASVESVVTASTPHHLAFCTPLNCTGITPTGWSLRRGKPSQSSGMRIRLRSGWPVNSMPYMS
jgi:hypothetical protein